MHARTQTDGHVIVATQKSRNTAKTPCRRLLCGDAKRQALRKLHFFFSRGVCFHFEGELVCNHQPHHIEDDKRLCRSIKGHCNTGESGSLCFAVAVWGRPMPCRVYCKWYTGTAGVLKENRLWKHGLFKPGRINGKKKRLIKSTAKGRSLFRGGFVCVL